MDHGYYLLTTTQMSVLCCGICEHVNTEREIFTVTGGNFIKVFAAVLVTPQYACFPSMT